MCLSPRAPSRGGSRRRALSPGSGAAPGFPHRPHQLRKPLFPTQSSQRRTQSSWRTRVISQALPISFSENDTKGLLIKSRARHLKGLVGKRDASGGRAGPRQGTERWGRRGRFPLLRPPRGEESLSPRTSPFPRFPKCRMGTATTTLARPPRWAVRSAGRRCGFEAFVQHILSARHSVKQLGMHDLI